MDRKESSLAAETSEHVRAILEAAERSAAEMRLDAERRASAHVARVTEAAEAMLGRLDELQTELRAMVEALKSAAQEEDIGAAEPADAEDEAAARITALNMALSGTPREETAAYLAEHYELADVDALLDDVYSKAGQ